MAQLTPSLPHTMVVPASTLILASAALVFTTTVLLLAIIALRLQAILPPNRAPPKARTRSDASHLMIVLGSGGHTAEMIAMLATLDTASYTQRTYIVSSGDGFSARKAKELEEELDTRREIAKREAEFSYTIITVPRARRIHQPLYTTPITVLQCLFSCLRLLCAKGYPDVIVTNGPATGCIVVVASVILRFLDLNGANSRNTMRTVYAESFARVKTLSLTGWLLQNVVDRFGVQWPDLAASRREYWGILV